MQIEIFEPKSSTEKAVFTNCPLVDVIIYYVFNVYYFISSYEYFMCMNVLYFIIFLKQVLLHFVKGNKLN